MTLDDMAEILSWPIAELDPFRLSVRLQVMRIVFAIGAKTLLDGKLGRELPESATGSDRLDRYALALIERAPVIRQGMHLTVSEGDVPFSKSERRAQRKKDQAFDVN
jgi:hypothetical protein